MSDSSAPALTPDRVASTVELVGSQLDSARRYYPRQLPPHHYARLAGSRPQDDAPQVEVIGRPGHGQLTFEVREPGPPAAPLPRRLELCRDQAEALLVHHRLGQVILGVNERERLTVRALGILPDTESDRFGELLGCPELHPDLVGRSATALLAAVETVERGLNPATALAYGMLVLAGVRSPVQLAEYAAKIDKLFSRVISAPSVIQALDLAGQVAVGRGPAARVPLDPAVAGARFQRLFGILLAVRDQLWTIKPGRASTPFLLTQVLDGYLGPRREVGNSLGLGVLDAVVVGKLGFPVRFHIENDVIGLEVLVENRSVYWDTTRPTPLSFVPLAGSRPLTLAGLFAAAYGSLATAHFNTGRMEPAVKVYRQVLELAPDSAPTHNSIAACRLRQRMPDQALAATDEALRIRPDLPEAHYTAGNAWAMAEQWPRAIACFKRAIALRPDYVEVYNNLGFAFQRSGSPEQAIAAFEAAIEIRPDYFQAHFNLGNIHLELEHYQDAVRCYREAARLAPQMAQAWYNMGQALYRMGELDPAITAYRRAVAVNPKHFGAWHNLGIAYRDKGMKDKAVEALERAVAINPSLMR